MAQKRDPLGGLEGSVIELPFTEGLSNNFSKHFRAGPKDALLVVENADLSEVGKFKNRNGYVSLSNTRTGPESGVASLQGTQQKLFQRKDELGIISNAQLALGSGAGWGGDGDTIYSFTPNLPAGTPTGAWKAHGKIARPTLGNIGNLTPDVNVRVSDMAIAGNFAIVAWHSATQIGTAQGNIYFRVIDITNNVTVIDTTECPSLGTYIPGRTNLTLPAIGTNTARTAVGNGYQAKLQCLSVGNRLYVFMLASQDSSGSSFNDLVGFYIDMSVANPAPSALAVILSSATGLQSFSATTDGTAIYVAVCQTTGPLIAAVRKLNTSFGVLGSNSVTLGGGETGIYDINCSAGSGILAVTCTTYRTTLGIGSYGVAQYAFAFNLTNSLTVIATALKICEPSNATAATVSNSGLFRPDIIALSSTQMLACVSYDDGITGECIFWIVLVISAGATAIATALFTAQGIMNVARLFLQSGRVMLPVVKCSKYPSSGYGIDGGYFLVELEAAVSRGGTDVYRLPMLAANWATDISAPVLDSSLVSAYLPIDYGPAMVAAGGAPNITIVSTKTLPDGTPSGILNPVPILVNVNNNGAYGSWSFRVSYDNGNTFAQVEQTGSTSSYSGGATETFPLTGPGDGFALLITTNSANTGMSWTASYRSTRQQALPNGAVSGNKYYLSTRSGSALGDKPTPLFTNYLLDAIVLDFADAYRWASRPSSDITVFGSSAMCAYDGRRSFEAGITARPRIASINRANFPPTSVISVSADGTVNPLLIRPGVQYFFRAVITWLDANGDRWFSAPSYAARKGDAFSVTALPYFPFTPYVLPQYSGPFNQGTLSLQGSLFGSFKLPFRATLNPTGPVLEISYDNGASIAQSFPATAGTTALTGLGAGFSVTYAVGAPAVVAASWELPAQPLAVQVELPACFSGMVSGTDYFRNAAEVWLYMTTASSVSTYFLAARATADASTLTHYSPFQSNAIIQFAIKAEPPSSADQMYTAGGELENSAAPPSRIIEAYRDRLLAISGYDNKVYYTKPRVKGRGLEWCQQTQYFQIPEVGMGLASNETNFLIFTSRGVYAIEGYGPSATGQPANAFGTLQLITNQVGLYEVNSCRSTPIGVVFRTSQGWWLIDRAMSLSYIGEDTDGMVAVGDQTLSIEVDQKFACIRFMMVADGIGNPDYRTYNYWYDSKRWSTDSSNTAKTYKDAMVLGDVYFQLDGQDVLARSSLQYGTSWVDGQSDPQGHGPFIGTGWLTIANIAMLKRIWRVIVVCENLTPGLAVNQGVRLDVWADWDDTAPILTYIWSADLIGAGVRTLRAHLPKQKMKAIRISVSQTSGNAPNNANPGYNFIGLGFQIGTKERMSTEPVARSA